MFISSNYGKIGVDPMAQAAFPSGKIPKKSSFTPRSSAPALPVAAPLGSVDFFERNRCCAGRCPWRLSSEHKPQLEAEGIGRGAATWHGIWHMKLLCKDMQRWSNDQGSTCFNWLVWTQIWTKQTKNTQNHLSGHEIVWLCVALNA